MIFGSLTDRASILENEQGALTYTQRDLLRLTSGLTFWYALGSAVAIIGIVAWAMNTQMVSLPANAPPIPEYLWIVLAIAIGTPLLFLGWQMVRSAWITHELASGGITSEEGRVEWTGRRYRVAASAKGLRSVYGPLNLMPGRYQFYLLPGSRYLLSADPLDTPQVSCAALTGVLGQVLGFTKDDLAANREGRISPAQATRLRSRAIQTGLLATVFLAVFVGAFVLAFTFRSTWYLVSFGIWLLISLLVLPSMIHYSMDRLRERHGSIASVRGHGSKDFRRNSRALIKSYVVSGKRFDVSGRAYDAMVEGEAYRVHYTPIGETILSVEAIPPSSPPPAS
ncbi:MAG: hypothetical protein HY690_07665 [Chloroflexi bacterium]|nr:hypothetical protein [Chloroflexota bacterium]